MRGTNYIPPFVAEQEITRRDVTIRELEAQLAIARLVIREFVHPLSPMTPEQKTVGKVWLQVNGDVVK